MSKATFELFTGSDDEWRWRLRHENGEKIATSGQSFASKQAAQGGIDSVRGNARGAAVEVVDE